jgi:hypothetical protein
MARHDNGCLAVISDQFDKPFLKEYQVKKYFLRGVITYVV